MKPADCDIVDVKNLASGTSITVKIKGPSTYAVSFRMAAAGIDDAKPVKVLASSAGHVNEEDEAEVVDLPAGKHTILVQTPEDCVTKRTYIGLMTRTYNVLDRIVEEMD